MLPRPLLRSLSERLKGEPQHAFLLSLWVTYLQCICQHVWHILTIQNLCYKFESMLLCLSVTLSRLNCCIDFNKI